jgi:tetratricopeptide (TPR) repeat protein
MGTQSTNFRRGASFCMGLGCAALLYSFFWPTHDFTINTKQLPLGQFRTHANTWLNQSVLTAAHTYHQTWVAFQKKLRKIKQADQENATLRLENIQLKLQLETHQLQAHSMCGALQSKELGHTLQEETGSKTGRTLATLSYAVPNSLPPEQLYTLGIAYLKSDELEKSVAIFTHLYNLKDHAEYHTSKILLLLGVTWYNLENYSMADSYFSQILKEKKPEELASFTQARLWKAVIAQQFHKSVKAQFWLHQLIENDPQSREAQWVSQ